MSESADGGWYDAEGNYCYENGSPLSVIRRVIYSYYTL